MKLASLKSSKRRDGELCIVNKALTRAVRAGHIANTLQEAIDHWSEVVIPLTALYDRLNKHSDEGDTFAFDSNDFLSPLPRAYQWADGSAYVNHVELVRKARGADMPQDFWTNPLMYQGGSDSFLAPNQAIEVADTAYGIDFEAEVAVITDDVPMGISANHAGMHIKLIMLVNDVSLRHLIPAEINKGFGFFQSKPSSSFSPIALTPDELGNSWQDTKVHLPLFSYLNGQLFGAPEAGIDMTFSFAELIAHAAKTRPLCAGSIIGSGTVSNTDRQKGSSCIAEKRMLELLEYGEAKTPFMQFGDTIRIEMSDDNQQSLFGAIHQTVVPYQGYE